jgi:hypothetical protein
MRDIETGRAQLGFGRSRFWPKKRPKRAAGKRGFTTKAPRR